MKRFRFSLQKILQLRRQAEDDRRRALGEVGQRIGVQQRILQGYLDRMTREDQRFRDIGESGILDINRIKAGRSFLLGLKLKVGRSHRRIRSLAVERKDRVVEYIEARKKKRVLELLQERQRENWRRDMQRQEQAEADDFATMGYRRKKGADR